MKLRVRFSVLTIFSLVSTCVLATPATFQFVLPNWTNATDTVLFNPPLFGTSGILTVTVDNKSGSSIGQTYLNSDVTTASVTSIGGTFNQTWANAFGPNASLSFISTNSSGVPILDLRAGPSPSNNYLFRNGAFTMQLGRTTATGGYNPLSLLSGDFDSYAVINPQVNGAYTGFMVQGSLVPEPSSFMLFAFGAVGLVAWTLQRGRNHGARGIA